MQDQINSGRLERTQDGVDVNVLMEDGSTYAHKGKLQFSDVSVDRTTGEITLRTIVPNPEHRLLPGMFVRARLNQGKDSRAIIIPQQAVTHTPRGDALTMVVNSQNKVEARKITLAGTIGNKWRISGGLSAGERVIVSGIQRVQPGTQVTPQEMSADDKS
ncbi:efflux RND transporter periplasmic adaptor subunit [Erwinia sp. S63]|uniref:efflux RND transporter periplasmic adaptor subunit n=1 Tax=Erwiniaceae TaxID=1903409 RepID=UPI00190B095E|nr:MULTISPECIES: efflux RND transporter periplasmic adaptor subunit [Erwiniaceae]MBK0099350.1 efflux RND transporter periplasmic adaptor subunit [Erwinia sp. S63]MBK0127340.1 efflux RND transporter periplasmic adaptor subunit [Pantoea sp. S61]